MLAASVSVGTAGEIQAKIVNYGDRGVRMAVRLLEPVKATVK